MSIDIETETGRVREFIRLTNYHAAYNIALSALNACRRENDRRGVDHFIRLIREIVDALEADCSGGADR